MQVSNFELPFHLNAQGPPKAYVKDVGECTNSFVPNYKNFSAENKGALDVFYEDFEGVL